MDQQSSGSVLFGNILHLTDFSASSDAACSWAMALAHASGAKLALLHVVVPDALTCLTPDSRTAAIDLQETWAREQMQQLEPRLTDLKHETFVVRGSDVWSAVAPRLGNLGTDLIVLGTHGRTGVRKVLMGSVAEKPWICSESQKRT
jgi:nucleotide-binding universal stress UspA family protein